MVGIPQVCPWWVYLRVILSYPGVYLRVILSYPGLYLRVLKGGLWAEEGGRSED